MIPTKSPKNTVPNIWIAQENLIQFYRLLSAGLGLLAILMFGLLIAVYFRDPIVVMRGAGAQQFYPSSREKVPLEVADVESFANNFLTALYVWQDFDTQQLAKEIAPFAEDGLVEKVLSGQSQKYAKELKGKRLAQSITFVKVKVLPDRVVCHFDRILKIEGMPLVIPTDVTLSMIEGRSTRLNPKGIYVGGIEEHEGAK